MRVALIISGYLRSLETNLENIKEKLINCFDNVDIYLHITENEYEEDKYLNIYSKNIVDYIKNNLQPIVCLFEPNIKFSSNQKKNALYNQWIKYYKLNSLKKLNEDINGKYDLVIKTRPDLHLNSEINFKEYVANKNIYIPKDSKIDQKKLKNIGDKYLTDSFAFGGSDAMNEYFGIYENLDKLIDKVGYVPETVIYEYANNNLNIVELDIDYYIILSSCNVFAICGDSSSGKSTLGNLLSKYFSSSFLLECDRYHKWERGDENWNKFTHLNPNANFIAKMNQDIFDLKIGKTIYYVDYNHKNGKFTQKQKIKSSENLIVCGLHSLYSPNKNVFNIKIFMDTDEVLKRKWKIKRDVEKRNHNEESVLKQIEKRKIDFEKYILPQKDNSDIIVNFYELENNKLSLLIKLRKDLNCEFVLNQIIEHFKNSNIFLENNFTSINFNEYENNEILNQLNYRTFDFYDYIIYILMNLGK
jgi:uridine kinase